MPDDSISLSDDSSLGQRPAKPRTAAPAASAQPAARRRSSLTPFLRTWHKRAGLFAFLFMGWLGLSGILINQSPSWGYDTDKVYWSWVMWLYGLEPEPPSTGLYANGHWLAVTPEGTALNGSVLTPPIKTPIGMVAAEADGESLLFVATPDTVSVVTLDGTRFDDMGSSVLPVSAIRRIGRLEKVPGSVVIQDLDAYLSTDGGLSWSLSNPNEVSWSEEVALPAAEMERLRPLSRPFVTLEHVLVDAHSGAIFGRSGVYVINTVGLMAIWLAISGLWMWWRTGRRL